MSPERKQRKIDRYALTQLVERNGMHLEDLSMRIAAPSPEGVHAYQIFGTGYPVHTLLEDLIHRDPSLLASLKEFGIERYGQWEVKDIFSVTGRIYELRDRKYDAQLHRRVLKYTKEHTVQFLAWMILTIISVIGAVASIISASR